MQVVYLTPNERRAFAVALKVSMMNAVTDPEYPGAFIIPGVDIVFRVGTPPTQKETE